MTYNADEATVYRGRPIELYKFEGTFRNYYYTSHNEDVVYEGKTYLAKAIKRSRIKVSVVNAGGSDLSIDLPGEDQLVKDYGFNIAPPELVMTLTRYHEPTDVIVYWKGNVTNLRLQGDNATLTCPNEGTRFMSGEIPSDFYQSPCNRVLGDARCQVDLEAASHETFMVTYTTNTVTVQSDNLRPDGYYAGGYLTTPFEVRSIASHVGNVITLTYPLTKRNYAMPVKLRPGCDHAYEGDCLTKFNNQPNFGGFPFIPTVNPFAQGID